MIRFLRNAVLCTIVFAVALLISIGVQQGWKKRGTAAMPIADAPSPEVIAGIGGRGEAHGDTRIALIIGGVSHPANGQQIALPDGARFQLRLSGDRQTDAEVFAISPAGQSSALWQGTIRGRSSITSPTLELQGARGLETLRVALRDASGRLSEQRIEIWHL